MRVELYSLCEAGGHEETLERKEMCGTLINTASEPADLPWHV